MLKDASRRRFDVVMAWSIDRLGRSLIDLSGAGPDGLPALDLCGRIATEPSIYGIMHSPPCVPETH